MQVKAQETESVFVSVFFVLEGTAGFKSVWTALLLYKWHGDIYTNGFRSVCVFVYVYMCVMEKARD